MDLTPEVKSRIDSMSYTELLSKWRFAPVGDPLFQGESGEYFASRLGAMRHEDEGGHVAASKAIGWER